MGLFFPGRSCTSQSCINNRALPNKQGTLKALIMLKKSPFWIFPSHWGKMMAKGIRWSLRPTASHTAADCLCHSTSVRQSWLGLLVSPQINGMTEKKIWVSTNSVLSLYFPSGFLKAKHGVQLNLHWVLPPVHSWHCSVLCYVGGDVACPGNLSSSNGVQHRHRYCKAQLLWAQRVSWSGPFRPGISPGLQAEMPAPS